MNLFGKVETRLRETIVRQGFYQFTLVDPEQPAEGLSDLAAKLDEAGTDGFLVGGSSGFSQVDTERTISLIKAGSQKPVVLFPGGLFGLARNADALLFLTLMNSSDPYFIVGAQAQAAPYIIKLGLETIPVAYIVFGSDTMVSAMGMTHQISVANYKAASAYSAAAMLMGMRAVYLEGGSGAAQPVAPQTIKAVKQVIGGNGILIVGGGIRSFDAAKAAIASGADVLVTGTAVERGGVKAFAEILDGCRAGAEEKQRSQ